MMITRAWIHNKGVYKISDKKRNTEQYCFVCV